MQIVRILMTSLVAILKVSALNSGKDFLRFFSSGKLASCDLQFYRRKEDNVVSNAIVFSLPKHNFYHSSLRNWNE